MILKLSYMLYGDVQQQWTCWEGERKFSKKSHIAGGISAVSRIYDEQVLERRFRDVYSANPTYMAETKHVAL